MKKPFKKTKKFPGKREELGKIRNYVHAKLENTSLTKEDVYRITLAVDEACANIIEHNYEEHITGKAKRIGVAVESTDEQISIIIEDEGVEFNPLDMRDPDLDRHLQEYRKHGLGIYLIRRLMDEITYHYIKNKGNRLELVKYLNIHELK